MEASKDAVSPLSHSWPMDMSEVVNDGSKWHFRADGGRWGMFSRPSCVDRAVVPSGSWTVMGCVDWRRSLMQLRSRKAM